jgi:hypothetical protein
MPEAEWGEATPLSVVRLPMRGMVDPKSWFEERGGGGVDGRDGRMVVGTDAV